MSNRLFQGIIHQMKDAVDRIIGVIDENGVIISCSELVKIGETCQGIRDELAYTSETVTTGGYTYRQIGTSAKPEYVVFVEGEDKMAEKISMILAISLNNIKNLYDEKYDKGSFIKNIILDNILPSDIYIKSKELHFNADVMRIVFLIKFFGKSDVIPFDMVQNMFPDKNKDYVISVGEHDIVLVKEVKPNFDMKEIEKIAKNIADTLSSEFYAKVSIGIGTAVDNIKDLARSFKEAQVAIEVGKVFDTEKKHHQLRESRHRSSYLSVAYDTLRYVPAGGIQEGFARKPRSRNTHDYPVLLREQPERFRNLAQAVCAQKHARIPPREDPQADRSRPARI